MKLTKIDLLRINEWNEANRRAREDYREHQSRHCPVWWCFGLRADGRTHCVDHAHDWDRMRQRVLGEPRSW